ncbi:MAG: hypothetical protein HGA33_04290 [Candidatus Moranbacteria bacterium]|nr:hypothetical protein [Candidatus Moranbacteria bacterium]
MILITLSGTDGSGKSTQLSLLRQHFENDGKRVAYFHAVEFSLANRLNRNTRGKSEFKPGEEIANTKASTLSMLLRRIFFAVDLVRFQFFLRSLRKKGTDILLSDRYFYDTFINLAYLSRPRAFRCPGEHFIPRPDAAFFLDIAPEAVMRRERVPEQGIEYIEDKRRLFTSMTKRWKLVRIDADQSKEDVFSSILTSLNS